MACKSCGKSVVKSPAPATNNKSAGLLPQPKPLARPLPMTKKPTR